MVDDTCISDFQSKSEIGSEKLQNVDFRDEMRDVEHARKCPMCIKHKVWFTAKEAAAYLCITVKTLYNWKCLGKIRGRNFFNTNRGAIRFKKEELDLVLTGGNR